MNSMFLGLNSYFWLVFLPLHAFFLLGLGSLSFSFASISLVFLFWTLLSGFGVGVAYHRLLSHRSFQSARAVEYLLSYLGVLAVQGSPIFWVALHNGYHHRYSDTQKDIHSPIHGALWAYLLWPIRISYNAVNIKYAGSLVKDPVQLRFFHYGYFFLVWGTWLALYFLSPAVFSLFVLAQMITLHQEFCVNYFCHRANSGYRNFTLDDHSNNRFLFGLLCWGVGFHNNHHARPKSYDFGYAAGEIDFTKYLVRLVEKRPAPAHKEAAA